MVIFDLSQPVAPKRRGKKTVTQEEASEKNDELHGGSLSNDASKRKRGRPRKNTL